MKKILILVDKIGPKKKLFTEIISRHMENTEVNLAKISDLYFYIDDKNVEVEIDGNSIKDYDLVYIRRAGADFSILASTLAVCLNHLGIKFIDTSWGEIGPMGSKFTSLVRLAKIGSPIMPTIYIWSTKIEQYQERIVKTLGLPLIAKEVATQRGKGVYKINSLSDFDKLPKVDAEGKENQYLFQKFASLGDEFRLLVLGDKVGVWEKKIVTVSGEFRHNVSLGAKEEFLDIDEIPSSLEDIAVAAAKALNLQIAGVDVAMDKTTGKYILIEVNRGPGFTYDTKISPEITNIAKFLENIANEND